MRNPNIGNVGALRQVNIQGTSYIFYDSNGLVGNPLQQSQQNSSSEGRSFVNSRRIPTNGRQFQRRRFPGPNTASIGNHIRLTSNSYSQQQQHTNQQSHYLAKVTSNNHSKSNKMHVPSPQPAAATNFIRRQKGAGSSSGIIAYPRNSSSRLSLDWNIIKGSYVKSLMEKMAPVCQVTLSQLVLVLSLRLHGVSGLPNQANLRLKIYAQNVYNCLR
ncbi:hypothetical protein GQX74_011884 [Glossina fuscipes]|nr:hypothetical protein GQX74_011884 [Glossina fuscipes]